MEKLIRVEFNWVSNEDYKYYEAGINCISIADTDKDTCRVLVSATEEGNTFVEIHNINTKVFKDTITA